MDTPLPPAGTQDAEYDADFAAWTSHQAALLRAGKFAEADIAHIAEEIEDLGKSNRAAVSSQVRLIIVHLMKLQASPAADPRNGWRSAIENARAEIEDVLQDSPSLRREIAPMIARQIERARRIARTELTEHGESAGGLATLAYTPDQVLGPWMPG